MRAQPARLLKWGQPNNEDVVAKPKEQRGGNSSSVMGGPGEGMYSARGGLPKENRGAAR